LADAQLRPSLESFPLRETNCIASAVPGLVAWADCADIVLAAGKHKNASNLIKVLSMGWRDLRPTKLFSRKFIDSFIFPIPFMPKVTETVSAKSRLRQSRPFAFTENGFGWQQPTLLCCVIHLPMTISCATTALFLLRLNSSVTPMYAKVHRRVDGVVLGFGWTESLGVSLHTNEWQFSRGPGI
jgi:hypothetical protein